MWIYSVRITLKNASVKCEAHTNSECDDHSICNVVIFIPKFGVLTDATHSHQ